MGWPRLTPSRMRRCAWIDEQLAAGEGIVTLLASNVGLLHKERLFKFLGDIRQRTEGRGVADGCRLAVVLTGEIDLGRAMLPPHSEFACGNQYLLYGFDREVFDRITRRYLKVIGRFVEPPNDEELAEIYRRTGGNTHFLRLILWSLFDRRAGDFDSELRPVRIGEDSDETVAANIRWNSPASPHPRGGRERSRTLGTARAVDQERRSVVRRHFAAPVRAHGDRRPRG